MKYLDHQVRRERVDARRHRRVGGEDVGRHHLLPGLDRSVSGLFSSSTRMRSSARNALWPSFMWKTVGRDVQRFERAHAADAQDDFLLDAHLGAAAVELGW